MLGPAQERSARSLHGLQERDEPGPLQLHLRALFKRALDAVTEPYLRLFRRLLPTARIGSVGLDLSALVGLVVLFVAMQVLARI
jgi:hypothetical protein